MKYTKKPLNRDELAEKIIARGLQHPSKDEMADFFQYVSYYRISGCWKNYKQPDDTLKDDSTFKLIFSIYCFDRDLRLLVLRTLQLIENTLRAQFIDYFATTYNDPFSYLDYWNFPNMDVEYHQSKIRKIHSDAEKSDAEFLVHYRTKYSQEKYLPVWMALEIISFGSLVYLCKGSEAGFKKRLEGVFDMPYQILDSWWVPLRVLRNHCAHHERIWDRKFSRPRLKRPFKNKYPKWHSITVPQISSVMFRLPILEHLVSKIPYAQFSVYNELCLIIERYPEVP